MKRRFVFLTLAMVLALSSCTLGSREVLWEQREVGDFDRVVFSSIGELSIVQGDTESLTIQAESNVLQRIVTEVRGNVLHIEMKTSFPWMWGVISR
jgi:hypothetical protein